MKEHSYMTVYTNDLYRRKGKQFREGFPRLSSKGGGGTSYPSGSDGQEWSIPGPGNKRKTGQREVGVGRELPGRRQKRL